MRGVRAFVLIGALLVAGCDTGPHQPPGVVAGHFSVPGRPTSDLQRGGLNFSTGSHGDGHGRTVNVNVDGSYAISLPPGSYSVIGGLAKHAGSAAESCAATLQVVVTANTTTNIDYVCDPRPATG